jgi:hypothetical protein
MDDAKGEMNVMAERRLSKSHLRESAKLRGISGSVCDSHPTIPLSRSERGSFAGPRRGFLLRLVSEVAILDSRLLVLALDCILSIEYASMDFRGPALIDALVLV